MKRLFSADIEQILSEKSKTVRYDTQEQDRAFTSNFSKATFVIEDNNGGFFLVMIKPLFLISVNMPYFEHIPLFIRPVSDDVLCHAEHPEFHPFSCCVSLLNMIRIFSHFSCFCCCTRVHRYKWSRVLEESPSEIHITGCITSSCDGSSFGNVCLWFYVVRIAVLHLFFYRYWVHSVSSHWCFIEIPNIDIK